MKNENLKLVKNEIAKVRGAIYYYARLGRIKLEETEQGVAYKEEDLKQARMSKKSMKKDNIAYITNEDLKLCPYLEANDKGKRDNTLQAYVYQNKTKRYFNTDTNKVCYSAFDILQREISNISKKIGLTKEDVIYALQKKYQEKQQ